MSSLVVTAWVPAMSELLLIHCGQTAPASEALPTDSELVAAARIDPHAFTLLYQRYVNTVHRYCYRRLGTREAAEDATSQIFMKVLASLPACRNTSFRAWLFAIAHNEVIDRRRRERPSYPLDGVEFLHDRSPSPEDQALAGDDARRIQALLRQLPEHQRQVIELRMAGLTGTEIATALGRSQANVHVTQFRALSRLRELVERERQHEHEHEHGTDRGDQRDYATSTRS
jgi:RNA polymerase sigma-70 factor (ECF subfamily)